MSFPQHEVSQFLSSRTYASDVSLDTRQMCHPHDTVPTSSYPLTGASDEVAISPLAQMCHPHGVADDAGYPTLHIWTQLKAAALTQPLQNLERTEITTQ